MTKLVAIALPGGPGFAETLQAVWDRGDAALPLDVRLPAAERDRVLAATAPASMITTEGETQLEGGADLIEGDALVVATSGTTGHPKGVIHTHDSIRASAIATSEALEVDPASDRWIACLPLAHVGGLSVVTRAIHTGTPVEIHDGFDPARVLEGLGRGATLISLVTKTLGSVPIERFRRVLIGGAAPPPDRADNVIATYGMTETGSGVVYERAPLSGVELALDDDGELLIRCPMLLRAYRDPHDPIGRDPRTTDGWFPTGDLASFDNDGALQVFGRKGDVIVTGGEKVWPSRIEDRLAKHPGVAEVAVIGRPDPEWGHRAVALVVPVDRAAPPSLEDLRAFAKEDLPTWYAPKELELREALPRTSLGKLRRGELA